jgi:hypothetical protein
MVKEPTLATSLPKMVTEHDDERVPSAVLTTYLRNANLHLLLGLTRDFLIKITSVLLQDYCLLGCVEVALTEASLFHTYIP